MTICKHCGAPVYGDVCEYCDMPTRKPAPLKAEYKPKKTHKILKFPKIKPLPLPQKGKKLFRKVLLIAGTVLAINFVVMIAAINHNITRTYIASPVTEYAVDYHHGYNEYDYDDCYDYNDDSYLLEEAEPEYDEERPVYDTNEILSKNGVFPEGTYQIGVDIPEGTYIFIPDMADGHAIEGVYADPECENQISSAYVHFDGSRIAEISGNGYLDFSWATAYNLDMHPEIMNDPHFTDGMFIVGRDIPAGTYCLEPYGEYGEWYIYSSINAIGMVLKESGVISEGDGYVENVSDEITLSDGEILELRDCIIG